jgi:hypothetical protein
MSKESNAAKIAEVAQSLGVDPSWLDALINFESAGSYDPLKAGPISTGARGLIQVTDSTARDFFKYQDSLELAQAHPTFDDNMDNVVYPYLAHYKKQAPYTTQQSLYMAVFYPAYRFVDPNKPFPENVQKSNSGIRTPLDYIKFVNSRVRGMHFPFVQAGINPPLLLLIVAAGLWLIYKRF